MNLNAKRTGFTLVEFLLVIGLLGIVFTITLQMINPSSQIDKANAVKRKAHMREIEGAATQYILDGTDLSSTPVALPTSAANAVDICKQGYAGTACTGQGGYDLASQIVPGWLTEMPVDPVVERNDADNVLPAHDTGYRIWMNGVYPEVCAYYGDEPCVGGANTGGETAGDTGGIPDTTNPTFTTFSPFNGETEVELTRDLVITFSEPVNKETGNITITDTDGFTFATIDVTDNQVTGDGTNTITINPSIDFLNNKQYYVEIDATAFDDLAGNSFAGFTGNSTWSFTTATVIPDPIQPVCKTASTAVSTNINGGHLRWFNPSNATADDAFYAESEQPDSLSGIEIGETEILYVSSYGYAIPAGATINGIEMTMGREAGLGVGVNLIDSIVSLTKDGTTQTENKAISSDWSGIKEDVVYGGSTDLWATSWTPSDINSNAFGVHIAIEALADNESAYIDSTEICVYYTE